MHGPLFYYLFMIFVVYIFYQKMQVYLIFLSTCQYLELIFQQFWRLDPDTSTSIDIVYFLLRSLVYCDLLSSLRQTFRNNFFSILLFNPNFFERESNHWLTVSTTLDDQATL